MALPRVRMEPASSLLWPCSFVYLVEQYWCHGVLLLAFVFTTLWTQLCCWLEIVRVLSLVLHVGLFACANITLFGFYGITHLAIEGLQFTMVLLLVDSCRLRLAHLVDKSRV